MSGLLGNVATLAAGGLLGEVFVRVGLDTAQAEAGLAKTRGAMNAAASQGTANAKTLGTAWAAWGLVAGAAAAAFSVASVRAFMASEQAVAKLNNTLKNNPKLLDVTRGSWDTLAKSISGYTFFNQEAVKSAESTLGIFKLTGTQVQALLPLVVDLSEKFGIDLDTASRMVGKSVDGSTTSLRRFGIMVDTAKAKVDPFAATVDALHSAVGGFAQSISGTTAVRMAVFHNQIHDLQVSLGAGLVPVLHTLMSVLHPLLSAFSSMPAAGMEAAIGLGAVFAAVKVLQPLISLTRGAFSQLMLTFGQQPAVVNTTGLAFANYNTKLMSLSTVTSQASAASSDETAKLSELSNVSNEATASADRLKSKTEQLHGASHPMAGVFGKLGGSLAAFGTVAAVAAVGITLISAGIGFLVGRARAAHDELIRLQGAAIALGPSSPQFSQYISQVSGQAVIPEGSVQQRLAAERKLLGELRATQESGLLPPHAQAAQAIRIGEIETAIAKIREVGNAAHSSHFMVDEITGSFTAMPGPVADATASVQDFATFTGDKLPDFLAKAQAALADTTGKAWTTFTSSVALAYQDMRNKLSDSLNFVAKGIPQLLTSSASAQKQLTAATDALTKAQDRLANYSGKSSSAIANLRLNVQLAAEKVTKLQQASNLTADAIIGSMKANEQMMVTYQHNFDKLSKMGGPKAKDFLTYLVGLGQQGAAAMAAFAAGNKKAFDEAVTIWNKAGTQGKKMATDIQTTLVGSIQDLIQNIKDLVAAINGVPSLNLQVNPNDAIVAIQKFIDREGKAGVIIGGRIQVHHSGGYVGGSSPEVPALLQPGEFVVRKDSASRLGPGVLHALNRYHEGGFVDPYSNLARVLRPSNINTNALAQIAAVMATFSGAIGGPMGQVHLPGNVTSWIATSLRLAGMPATWAAAMAVLVSRESGGNPFAVNPTLVGTEHATGIAQTLPSTFRRWMLPGHGNILNAVDDLIASERYIGSRYGSPYHIPGLLSGRYQGYAEGGYIDHPQFALLGEKGPEYVIPAHRMTGATVHLHLNVNGDVYADDLEDIILDTVAQAIDRKVAV